MQRARTTQESDDDTEAPNKPETIFPNLDHLEPTHTSPGETIAQELAQAPVFQDITEPTDADKKGKSKEAYLPLNLSPTLPKASSHYITMASSSKERATEIKEGIFGISSINPKEDFSPFSSSFAPMKRSLPIGLQPHQAPLTNETKTTTTDGGLKGEGPEKFEGDKNKALEFGRDFILWWMQNKNNRAFQTPLSRIALFLGKMKGPKVTDWVSHMLWVIQEEVEDDPSLEEDKKLWKDFTERFEQKFTSASALEESRQDFEKYYMKTDDVDEYIAGFEDHLTKTGYNRREFGITDKFKHGLKKWIIQKILNRDRWPSTLDEWQEAARREVRRNTYLVTTLGDRKNFNLSLQEAKWHSALLPEEAQKNRQGQKKRNNDVVPMEVDFTSTQDSPPCLKRLTPDERKKLMDEGRCFKCRLKGHQARACLTKNQQTQGNTTSNARTTETTPKAKKDSPSTAKDDPPPAYDENQIAGLIRAMTVEQRETLLSKIVTSKGKGRDMTDDTQPSFLEEDNKGFWPPLS